MPNDVNIQYPVGQGLAGDGAQVRGRGGRTGEQMVTQVHGRYYEAARLGNIFYAQTLAVAPIAFGTEAASGGPYLYNPSLTHVAVLLGINVSVIVTASQAGALGLTFGSDEAVPTTTNGITASGNLLVGGSATRMNVFNDATTIGANVGFMPLMEVGTGAVTVSTVRSVYIPMDGMIVVPRRSFVSIAGSVVLTALQAYITFIYEEVPV